MEIIAIAARVVTGAVLLLAGGSKLRTRTWGLLALEQGTPRSVVITLPVFEVLLGAALVIQLGGRWVAWVSVMVFAVFTAFVAQRYASGSKAGCNCFGSTKSQEPVDKLTIARNVALLLIAFLGTLR